MRSDKIIYLQWYSDPAHAWLRISRKDAIKLNILDRISAYSYMSAGGQYLYLEEDCDATLALEALKESTIYLPCYNKTDRHDERSRVRHLPNYMAGIRQLKQDKLLDAAIEAGILHIKVIR